MNDKRNAAAEVEDQRPKVDGPQPAPLSWLPMSLSDPTATTLSLTSCSLNIDSGCGFHEKRKAQEYLRAWSSPAPAHCQQHRKSQTPEILIHADRLGIDFTCDGPENVSRRS